MPPLAIIATGMTSDRARQVRADIAAASLGTLLAVHALRRGHRGRAALSLAGAAGGWLAWRALQFPRLHALRASVLVNVSAESAYALWRNPDQVARFSRHIRSVTALDERRWRWEADLPAGLQLTWVTTLTSDDAPHTLAWTSASEAAMGHEGRVQFRPSARGTLVVANIHYRLPGGAAAARLARLLNVPPGLFLRQELRRFKALAETGEVPTIAGQPHGRRSGRVQRMRQFNPDSIGGADRAAESLRRVS